MKNIPQILLAIGVLLLIAAGIGRVTSNPLTIQSHRITTILLLANSALLLAIAAKVIDLKK